MFKAVTASCDYRLFSTISYLRCDYFCFIVFVLFQKQLHVAYSNIVLRAKPNRFNRWLRKFFKSNFAIRNQIICRRMKIYSILQKRYSFRKSFWTLYRFSCFIAHPSGILICRTSEKDSPLSFFLKCKRFVRLSL